MKKISNLLYVTLFLALLGSSCKKDLEQTTLKSPASVPGFTASTSQLVLSNTNDSVTAVSFAWQAPNYGYTAATTYTLLFDTPADTSGTTAWGNAIKVNIATNSLRTAYLGTDFNKLLNQLGLSFGTASSIVVRLKADVNQSAGAASTVPSIYSDLSMTVTPYKIVLVYPKLYVAGDFLNPTWTQLDQPGWVLASVKSDENYEGYVNFPNAGKNTLKIVPLPGSL